METTVETNMKYSTVAEATNRKDRFSGVILIIQNILCSVFGIVILWFGTMGIFRTAGFFDLIFKVCLIPAVLMPAAHAGLFKKLSLERLGTLAFNKGVTEFFDNTTKLLLPLLLAFPLIEKTLEIQFAYRNTMLFIVLGAYVLNMILSCIKRYTKQERRYHISILLSSMVGIVGIVLFYFGIYLSFPALWTIGDWGTVFLQILGLMVILGTLIGILYAHRCLARFAFVSHSEAPWYTNLLFSAALVILTVPTMIILTRSTSTLSISSTILAVAGAVLVLFGVLLELLLVKTQCAALADPERRAVLAGKTEGYAQYRVSLNFMRIKQWNAGKLVLVAMLFLLSRLVFDLVAAPLFTLWLENFLGEFWLTLQAILKVDISWLHIALSLLVKNGFALAFIALCMYINGRYHAERPTSLLPEAIGGKLTVMIGAVLVLTLPAVITILNVFVREPMWTMLAAGMETGMLVITYYLFFGFLLREIRASKGGRIWLPMVFLLLCEGILFGLELCVALLLNGTLATNVWILLLKGDVVMPLVMTAVRAEGGTLIGMLFAVAVVGGGTFQLTRNLMWAVLPAVLTWNMCITYGVRSGFIVLAAWIVWTIVVWIRLIHAKEAWELKEKE